MPPPGSQTQTAAGRNRNRTRDRARLRLAAAVLLAAGCTRAPQPIRYGEEVCAQCRMVISDARYGAALVTTRHETLHFDAIECLAAHVAEHGMEAVASLWLTDYRRAGQLVPLEEVYILHSPALSSPMGGNLTAFGRDLATEAAQRRYGGQVLEWSAVVERARQRRVARSAGEGAPAQRRAGGAPAVSR